MGTKYPKYIRRHFHIRNPIYQASKMFGWKDGTWGLGLEKHKVDHLAKENMSASIKYNINKYQASPEYEMEATKIQKFPIYQRSRDNLECYIIPVFALEENNIPTGDLK